MGLEICVPWVHLLTLIVLTERICMYVCWYKLGLFSLFRMERHTALMQGTMAMWHVSSITCVSQICCQYECSLTIRISTFHVLPSLQTEISKPTRSWGGSILCKRVQCFRRTCCLYLQGWSWALKMEAECSTHISVCCQPRRLQSNQSLLWKPWSMKFDIKSFKRDYFVQVQIYILYEGGILY